VVVLLGLLVRLITLSPVSRHASVEPRLCVHFIDVGPGGSTLIRTPDNRTILVDAGSADRADHLVSYLASQGVRRIDLLVIAHGDESHIGGMPKVLDRFGVSGVVDAAGISDSPAYEQVLSEIKDRRIDYRTVDEARRPNLSTSVDIEIVWPMSGRKTDIGEPIVMRVGYKDISFLLTGDLTPASEGFLLAEYHDLRSTVLKVPNHGNPGTTSNEFLQIVKPEYAVISADCESESAQPGEETLDRLSAAGAKVFRTDRNGDIVISTDGLRVWTECSE